MAILDLSVIREALEFGREKLQAANDYIDRGDLNADCQAGIDRINEVLNNLTGDHDDSDPAPREG